MDPRHMDDVRRAVDEALEPKPQQVAPPPPLIVTGLVVEVRPNNFMGQPCVAITVRNQIAAATCAVPLDAIEGLIGQLEQARAEAAGLEVPRNGLVVP